MSGRTHLFVAIAPYTWGEVVLALGIAAELHERGDRVVFLAPSAMEVLFRGQPCQHLRLDTVAELPAAIERTLVSERCAALYLIDVSIIFRLLAFTELDASFLDRCGVPVIGLDVFDLAHSDLIWDCGDTELVVSPHALAVTDRLIPCPVSRPRGRGYYNSLPSELVPPEIRLAVRAKLALAEGERMVFLPLASWQQPTPGMLPSYCVRLGLELPRYLTQLLARLGDVRVVSVSREPMPELAAALGPRYQWLGRQPRREFNALLAASDLLVSLNPSGTTIGTAAVHGVPVLVGVCSFSGATPDEVVAKLPFAISAGGVDWLRRMGTLHPFRLWPLGFFRYTAHVFRDNPYTSILDTVELLDEEGFAAAGRRLLEDETARVVAKTRHAAYVATVRELPSAADVIDGYLAT